MSLGEILLIPGLGGYNLVDAAQAVTPLSELWTFKNNDNSMLVMVPFNATQAYYYDIVNNGDDCMIFRNAYRRLWTLPGTSIIPGAIQAQVKSGSNVELAIRCRKNGTSDTYRFFPQHEGVNTCVLVGSRTWTRDGVGFSANDSKYIQCSSTSVESLYNVIHPEQVDPLATLQMKHTVTAAKIKAEVSVEFLQDTEISSGFSIMNNTTLTPKSAAVGVNSKITPVTLTGSDQAAPGQGRVTSCAVAQTGDTTVLLSDWSGNLGAVLASQVYSNESLFQYFIDTTSKFYNQPFSSAVVTAGKRFSWRGEWRMAEWASLFS